MLPQPSVLRAAAKSSLSQARKPGQAILLHTGVVLLISLLLTLADFLLNRQISTTGGLSGMGARSVWVTVQSMLRLTQAVLLPFWQIGYTYYILRVAREQSPNLKDLLEGFRRFGPVLRLKMLLTVLTVILALACSYISSFIFMLTPWSAPLLTQINGAALETMDQQALMEAILAVTQQAMVPILIIFGLCFAAGAFILFFTFRLAEYWLMDHPQGGALAALRSSSLMMRGNRKAFLRLDFSFWWFYLLEILVTVLCYGDMILGSMGIEMTTDAFGSYFLFFTAYLCAQLGLYRWKRNQVSVTYAHAYLSLLPEEPAAPESKEE